MADNSLKNLFNQSVVESIADAIFHVLKTFDRKHFVADVILDLPSLELKARSILIANMMHKYLPFAYEQNIEILIKSLANDVDAQNAIDGMGRFSYLPFLNYISLYGLEYPEVSFKALREMTKYFSGEFDIRPFLIKYPTLAIEQAYQWSQDETWQVRRLSSEGTRTRLPWGMRVPELIKDPTVLLPILNRLYNDPNEIVRRSVANSLNDISKDYPSLAIEVAESWLKQDDSLQTKQVISHALRTLRKKANKDACALLGISHGADVELRHFSLNSYDVAMGGDLEFEIVLKSSEQKDINLVVHYVMHYQRKNGTTNAKTFKLFQRSVASGETIKIAKKYSFKKITTRSYYPGEHKIEIIAAGVSMGIKNFNLY